MLAPSILFLGMFTYFPMVSVVWDSLFSNGGLGKAPEFVGLENYWKLAQDDVFIKTFVNNIIYAVGTIVPSIILALLFALLLRSSSRFNSIVRSILFFPTLIPLVAAAGLWIFIFLPSIGLLDFYLAKLGARSVNWLGDPDIALYALMVLTVWKNAGYFMLFFLAGLQGIPEDSLEAALLEGASPWQRLRYVILPLLKPTTSFVLVIAFIFSITQVDHLIVLTEGGPANSTNLLLYYIFQNAHEFNNTATAAAATVISLVLLLSVSIFNIRILERGTHYES
ncbi:MAG: sugar ABC transporter permease [Paracoccaceae bacterium]